MSSSREFAEHARECVKLAYAAPTDEVRYELMDLARTCMRKAVMKSFLDPPQKESTERKSTMLTARLPN